MDTKELSIDKKEGKDNVALPTATAPVAATPAVELKPAASVSTAPKTVGKPFVTAGERIHNEVTYRIIDWVVNSTIGVGTAYLTTKHKWGKAHIGVPIKNFFKKVLKPVLRTPESLEEGAKWGSMFTSIIVGGTAIIPPVMVMEMPKVKTGIIRWLDKKWYGKQVVNADPKFEEAYRRIENEPKQGFWTGWAARAAVLTPMIIATVIPTTNNFMVKWLYDPIAKVSKWTAETIGIKPGKMKIDGEMMHPKGNVNLPKVHQSNWDFLHETIGFDLGLTFIYSFAHEWAYKAIAAMFGKDKPHAGAEAAVADAVNALPALPAEAEKAADAASPLLLAEKYQSQKKTILSPRESHTAEELARAQQTDFSMAP